MKKNLVATKNIHINASPSDVWDALTNPHKIKIYLYGTETITDWSTRSPILFQGEYQGQTYKDKGNVLENQKPSLLRYNYWSGFSGLEDVPENYSIITYSIKPLDIGGVEFTWKQEGFSSEEAKQHTADGLEGILAQIKTIAEQK